MYYCPCISTHSSAEAFIYLIKFATFITLYAVAPAACPKDPEGKSVMIRLRTKTGELARTV